MSHYLNINHVASFNLKWKICNLYYFFHLFYFNNNYVALKIHSLNFDNKGIENVVIWNKSRLLKMPTLLFFLIKRRIENIFLIKIIKFMYSFYFGYSAEMSLRKCICLYLYLWFKTINGIFKCMVIYYA